MQYIPGFFNKLSFRGYLKPNLCSPDNDGSVRAAIEKLNELGVKNGGCECILLSISSSLGELEYSEEMIILPPVVRV